MISIKKAAIADSKLIVDIGNVSVEEAHRDSCAPADLQQYLDKNYNDATIKDELSNPANTYHLIYYNNEAAGFSKIVLNAAHPAIEEKNVTKLDRIYLLKEFQGMKLGKELLDFNIELARMNKQAGIWLYTWVGNIKAIGFYHKAGFKTIGSHDFFITRTHSNPNYHLYLAL